MTEITLQVHRNMTVDPNDLPGILRYNDDRRKLLESLIVSLDLELRSAISDADENRWPKEVAEVIIALGAAGAFTAMVAAFKIWIERAKIIDTCIKGPNDLFICLKGATSKDVVEIATSIGLKPSEI